MKSGISPRRLFGWEPSTTTVNDYDDAGRLVRTVQVREPEFSDDDLVLVAAWLEVAADSPHGYPMSEATSPLADPNNREGTFKYEVGLPLIDHRQAAIEQAQEDYKNMVGKDGRMPKGLVWTARKVDR